MIGKAIVTCIEAVKYTNKKNVVKEGVIVHCVQPCLTDEREKMLSADLECTDYVRIWLGNAKVSRCWISIENLTRKNLQGLEEGCSVMIRAGKYGEYIDYVL